MDLENNKIINGLILNVEISDEFEFFHSSANKFKYPNKIANWFSPKLLNITEKFKPWLLNEQINLFEKNNFDYTFKLKKPIKLFAFPEHNSENNFELREFTKSLLNSLDNEDLKNYLIESKQDLNDYEYIFAYYINKYTNFDGYITPNVDYGLCVLCGDTSKILKLEKVEEYNKSSKLINIYNGDEWNKL
jgi:hypothetical protein